ncbi:hypothetical protein CALCODRAFT_520938 [Calocera cornea HHB12733]|uniref:Uncharacterized protein n=1 Tax=Calocera cornea HHB12733 TaxID=1353952 RepID=A0A165D4N2_9BASI|nr:hypothetical protein CALCODRAFT_520938 [Calocera cornea HHB12733]
MTPQQQDSLLEKHATVLLLKDTLAKVKKNAILRSHVNKEKLESTIQRLESEVHDGLKHKKSTSNKATPSKGACRSKGCKDDESDESDGEESDVYSDMPGKAQVTEDDEYELAHYLASAASRRKWGSYDQNDWVGFAARNKKRNRRGWRNWYNGNPKRKERIDSLVAEYKKELEEDTLDGHVKYIQTDDGDVQEIVMEEFYDAVYY